MLLSKSFTQNKWYSTSNNSHCPKYTHFKHTFENTCWSKTNITFACFFAEFAIGRCLSTCVVVESSSRLGCADSTTAISSVFNIMKWKRVWHWLHMFSQFHFEFCIRSILESKIIINNKDICSSAHLRKI